MRKQRDFLWLNVCTLLVSTVGSSHGTLLPVYTTRLGAGPAATGYYLALIFLALSVGTIVGGWLSDRFQRPKVLLIACAAVAFPATWLMGQTVDIPQLLVMNVISWGAGGVVLAAVGVLVALSAGKEERGRAFGVLGLMGGLGAFTGGLISGPIVDRWGFTTLFTFTALLIGIIPLVGSRVENRMVKREREEVSSVRGPAVLGRAFLLLFTASILTQSVSSESLLLRPLMMDQLGFDATTISSTAAVGSLFTVPFPFLMGWLSDRFGRKNLLVLTFLGTTLGTGILLVSTSTWHFWSSSILVTSLGASVALGSALVTDLVPRESVGSAVSLFRATPFIGSVIGFAVTGSMVQGLGAPLVLIIGVLLSVLAIVLLIPIREPARGDVVESLSTA